MESKEKNLNHSYYKSLTRNMALIVIIVSFTPMLLVGGIIYEQFQVSYREKVYAHLEELVRKNKQNIDGFLKEKLGDIRFVARSFTFYQISDEAFLQDTLTKLRQEFNNAFEDLGVINDEGIQIAYAGPFKLLKARYSEADWFKKALSSQYVISDVFLGLRGLPHFIVAVRQNHNGKYWILRATINFQAFNSLVENLRIGKTGFAFIVNKEGKFQTEPAFDALPDTAFLNEFLQTDKRTKDGIHISEKTCASDIKCIYVTALLKDGNWLMIYKQDSKDAFSELRNTQMIAFIIFFMGGLCIITMTLILSKGMVERISKADREKEMMNQQVIETGKLASVGELAAGIAHEINNPVAIMVEEAGWIKDLLEEEEFKEGKNLAEFQRALEQINTQGKRCKEITHKLLSFARKTDSRVQNVQLNDLIEDVVGLSAQSAKYNKVSIVTNFAEDLPLIKVSHTEIQQVLLNLINNALYAMEKKGGTIDIASQLEEDHIVITVADNGPGIPKANLVRIFDPFFTTKPVGKGTGLGLSICYGIIKKMGGAIDVQSVVDVGTTFRIRIPVKENSASPSGN
jgi:two-component system NtrC family sensor kinase